MWLLSIKTRALELFHEDNVPEYAILSHRWTDHEISFQDIQSRRFRYTGRWPPKLEGIRKKAKEHGYNYIWVDTCCIDKTSSSELEEAINSMFKWYKNAAVCYAYLPDVPPGDTPLNEGSNFRSSSWFTRGWTLQELIAPNKLYFYNAHWEYIGSKGEMSSIIERITGIPRAIVVGVRDPRQASIAQRMSWAANRVTTRKEDLAYCLLGVLGVTMPMIYGEGDKAFARLQEEVMKDTSDLSILAGGSIAPIKEYGLSYDLLLAISPSDFAGCAGVVPCNAYASKNGVQAIFGFLADQEDGKSQTFTPDIRLSCPVFRSQTGEGFAVLNCCLDNNPDMLLGIPILLSTPESPNSPSIPRTTRFGLIPKADVDFDEVRVTLVCKKAGHAQPQVLPRQDWWYLQSSIESHGFKMIEFEPSTVKVAKAVQILRSGSPQEIGPLRKLLLRFRQATRIGDDFVTALWFPGPSEPGLLCSAFLLDRHSPLKHLAKRLRKTDFRSGDESVKSGILNLHVSVSQESFDRGNIFAVKLSASSVADSAVTTRTMSADDVRGAVPQFVEKNVPHPSSKSVKDDSQLPTSNGPALWPRLILPFMMAIFSSAGRWVFACMLSPLLLSVYWEGTPVILLQFVIWLLYGFHSAERSEAARIEEMRLVRFQKPFWKEMLLFAVSVVVDIMVFVAIVFLCFRVAKR